MIRVHHLNNSRSQRVLWLLEELALPYEIVSYTRDRKTMLAPAALRHVHPLGKSPVVEDDQRVMAETGAIVDYLVSVYGSHLAPARDSPLYWRYVYWLFYADGSAMPPLLLKLVLNKLGFLGRPARGFVDSQLKLHLDYMEGELAQSPWFACEQFSAADIMMSFPLEVATNRAGLNPSRPRLWSFLQRIQARPAYRRALERGGKYAFLV